MLALTPALLIFWKIFMPRSASPALAQASMALLNTMVSGCTPLSTILSSHCSAPSAFPARAKAVITQVKLCAVGGKPISCILECHFAAAWRSPTLAHASIILQKHTALGTSPPRGHVLEPPRGVLDVTA